MAFPPEEEEGEEEEEEEEEEEDEDEDEDEEEQTVFGQRSFPAPEAMASFTALQADHWLRCEHFRAAEPFGFCLVLVHVGGSSFLGEPPKCFFCFFQRFLFLEQQQKGTLKEDTPRCRMFANTL